MSLHAIEYNQNKIICCVVCAAFNNWSNNMIFIFEWPYFVFHNCRYTFSFAIPQKFDFCCCYCLRCSSVHCVMRVLLLSICLINTCRKSTALDIIISSQIITHSDPLPNLLNRYTHSIVSCNYWFFGKSLVIANDHYILVPFQSFSDRFFITQSKVLKADWLIWYWVQWNGKFVFQHAL